MSLDADTQEAMTGVAKAAEEYAMQSYPTGTEFQRQIAFNAFVVGAQYGLVEAGKLFEKTMREVANYA